MITSKQFFTSAKKLTVYGSLLSGNAHHILIAFSQIAEQLIQKVVITQIMTDGCHYIEARYIIPKTKQEVVIWSRNTSIADFIYKDDESELIELIKQLNVIEKEKQKFIKLLK